MLSYISFYSVALPLLMGLIFFKRSTSALKLLCALIFTTAILEVGATILFLNDMMNLFMFHIHTTFEGIIIGLLYRSIFTRKVDKNFAQVSTISFIIFSVINVLKWEPLNSFNSNQRYFAGVMIIIFCLLYFLQLFREMKIQRLERSPYFLMSGLLLIYFAGTLFLFITLRAMTSEQDNYYWNAIHSSLNIILNLGYAIIIWVGRKSI